MHGPSRAASSIGMRSHLLTDIRISSGGMDNSGREGTDAKKPHAPRPAWLNSCALSCVEKKIKNKKGGGRERDKARELAHDV